MGIIERQTLKGSFFAYLGVALGFITVGLLWPRFLEPEEIGLINYLVAVSALLAQIGSFGFNNVTIRLFPEFRDDKSKHHGYLFLGLSVLVVGIALIIAYYFIFRDGIIERNMEKSSLISRYSFFIVPFTVVTLLFNFLEGLQRVMYNAVIGLFLKEFLFRVFNLVLVLAFVWIAFPFETFLNVYFLIFSIPTLVLVYRLFRERSFNLRPDLQFLNGDIKRQVASVGLFGLISGLGTVAVSSIDKIMINHFIDLEATGIYSIAILFGTIISVPARPLTKIASTILAESWKKNDLANIRMMYSKSSLTQLIFAGLIFLAVWLNVDLVFLLIGEEYAEGKLVILFFAISGVLLMATGINGFIITSSKHYRYQTYLVALLIVIVVISNLLFIPRWGITGAAVASLLSTLVYNAARVLLVYRKFGMNPFNRRTLLVVLLIVGNLVLGYLLQGIDQIAVRTVLIALQIVLLYALPVYVFGISEDINATVNRFFRKLRGI